MTPKKLLFIRSFLIAFLLVITFHGLVQSQKFEDQIVQFESFGIAEGISQNSVNYVLGDASGFLWIGTQAGIDRYDGYDFYNFENSTISEGGPSIIWCHSIANGVNGSLWFGDQLGNISRYNPFMDIWTNYPPIKLDVSNSQLPDDALKVNSILVDTLNNQVYYGTQSLGLIRLDPLTNATTKIGLNEKSRLQPQINDLFWLSNNLLLVASESGLFQFDVTTQSITNIWKPSSSFTAVRDIATFSSKILLLATDKGLWEYDWQKNSINPLIKSSFFQEKGSVASLTAVHVHSESRDIWMSVENTGLALSDSTATQLRLLTMDTSRSLGIESKVFFKIFEDRQGILWFASYTQGLMKFDPNAQQMQLLSDKAGSLVTLGFETVWGTLIDQKNQIWVGDIQPGGGIHVIDRTKKTNKVFLEDDPMVGSRRWAFAEDKVGGVWIYHNTVDDVRIYKSNTATITPKWVGTANSLGDKEPFSARAATYLTQSGDLLICGVANVIRIADATGNTKFDRYTPLLDKVESRILDFYHQNGQTYFITRNQLYKWDELTNQIEPLLNDEWGVDFIEVGASNDIQFVVLDGTQFFLPTYGKGLFTLDLQTGNTNFLTNVEGLPNRYLYNCYDDGNGNLWMSSNLGIIQYLVREQRFISYGPKDGAQAYEFNANSSFQSRKNELIFGGIAGINIFMPDQIKSHSNPPTVIIQSIQYGSTRLPYSHSGAFQKEPVIIDYADNSVSFEYVGLNFRNTEKNSYAYQLIGYDEELQQADNRRFQRYTNLAEGDYTFKVIASNHKGDWNEIGATFQFKILPPWYRTWWAYILYVLFIACGVVLYNSYRVAKERKMAENRRKEEELESARAFQQRMLPLNIPSNEFYQIDARQITSTEVGGDYYDFFKFESQKMSIVCGDATGHGAASGMMVSVTKSALQAFESANPEQVHEIMSDLNRVVKSMNLGTSRMSLTLMHIDNNHVRIASAGMPPVYVYRAATNQVEEYLTGDMPLGALRNQRYDVLEFTVQKNDQVVLVSDGLPEAPNPSGDLLDYERLSNCIQTHGQKSAKELLKELIHLGTAWMHSDIPPDDITVVVLRVDNLAS